MPNRAVGKMLSATALIGAMLTMAGCETLGNPWDVVTGKRTAPDEFLVIARKPLRMPGSLGLPEPRLGEPSPLEPDPYGAAVVALLGAPAVGPSTAGASPGERALLSAANATSTASPQLDEELRAAEERLGRDQPYEPPLLVDLISDGDDPDVEDALVPGAEARRLQRQGVAPAPIDPTDRPEVERTRTLPVDESLQDRRPNNRLPNSPNVTAF